MPIIDKTKQQEVPVTQVASQIEPPVPVEVINDISTNVNYATNLVKLPGAGRLYPPDNPLSSGIIEIKNMTTLEEDILTTESYIREGVVLEKFFQSMIKTKNFDYDSLLLGDRTVVIIASRIYGHGEDYTIKVTTPSGRQQSVTVDLTEIQPKELHPDFINATENLFTFVLPKSKKRIEFKILTVADEKEIEQKLKVKKFGQPDKRASTQLIQSIVSVDGNTDRNYITLFVRDELQIKDANALKEYINSVSPDMDLEIDVVDEATGEPFRSKITLGLDLFWPNAKV